MNDQELITAVRQSVHGVRMNVPAEQIVSRSRAIRASGHRKLAACITAVAAAGAVVFGLGLSGAPGAAPNGGTGTIRTLAFTLTRNANGTDTLTLTQERMLNPAALQQALARDGIRALVKADAYCSSNRVPHPPGLLSFRLPGGTPLPRTEHKAAVANRYRVPANVVTVINPAAMPPGTELFFGYFLHDHLLIAHLIDTSSYTCSPAGS